MTLPCIQQFTTVNFDKMTNKQNKYLVIHWVAAVSSAKNNASYFQNVYRGASAHYFVDGGDLSTCVYQVVSELNAAWHVGATKYIHPECRNANSIGIEICCIKDDRGNTIMDPLAIERAVELARSVCQMWKIPRERVLRHFDVTGKACPCPWNRDNQAWEQFKDKVFNDANNTQANNNDQSSSNQINNNDGKDNMNELLAYLGVNNEAEAKAKLKEHLGENDGKCDWGNDTGDRGGYLGSARRELSKAKSDLTSCQIDLASCKQSGTTGAVTGNSKITPTIKAGGKTLELKRVRIDTATSNQVAEYE